MHRIFILFLVICCVLLSCDSEVSSFESTKEYRIVSMSPGITNTLLSAGYGEYLVGRSPFCFKANESVPVVGDLREVDFERLINLHPTHVFVQKTESGIDSHLVELAKNGSFVLKALPMDRIHEIDLAYGEITKTFGNKRLKLEKLLANDNSLGISVLVVTQGAVGSAGMAFGKETYLDDVLMSIGVQNAVNKTGWISLSFEDIVRLNPDKIIVVSDSLFSKHSLEKLRTTGIPVIPFMHEDVLVPSSKIIDVASQLQKVLN